MDAPREPTKVLLNVYDLNASGGKEVVSTINKYAKQAMGLGAFHSGVEIEGIGEYGFGMIEHGTGVFLCEAKKCLPEKYKFRMTVEIGETSFTPEECKMLVQSLSQSDKFQGTSYDLTRNNCNHFSSDLCKELTGQNIPDWVNKSAEALDVVRGGVEYTAKTINDIANSDTVQTVKSTVGDIAKNTRTKWNSFSNDPRTVSAVEGTKQAAVQGYSMLSTFVGQCMDTAQDGQEHKGKSIEVEPLCSGSSQNFKGSNLSSMISPERSTADMATDTPEGDNSANKTNGNTHISSVPYKSLEVGENNWGSDMATDSPEKQTEPDSKNECVSRNRLPLPGGGYADLPPDFEPHAPKVEYNVGGEQGQQQRQAIRFGTAAKANPFSIKKPQRFGSQAKPSNPFSITKIPVGGQPDQGETEQETCEAKSAAAVAPVTSTAQKKPLRFGKAARGSPAKTAKKNLVFGRAAKAALQGQNPRPTHFGNMCSPEFGTGPQAPPFPNNAMFPSGFNPSQMILGPSQGNGSNQPMGQNPMGNHMNGMSQMHGVMGNPPFGVPMPPNPICHPFGFQQPLQAEQPPQKRQRSLKEMFKKNKEPPAPPLPADEQGHYEQGHYQGDIVKPNEIKGQPEFGCKKYEGDGSVHPTDMPPMGMQMGHEQAMAMGMMTGQQITPEAFFLATAAGTNPWLDPNMQAAMAADPALGGQMKQDPNMLPHGLMPGQAISPEQFFFAAAAGLAPPETINGVPLVLAEAQALIGLDGMKRAAKSQDVKPNVMKKPVEGSQAGPPSMTSKAVIRAAMNERVRKLDRLSRIDAAQLTQEQRDEKKKLMTLEKNRRAAQLSRAKKKRYVKALEDRVGLLARHLASLELENNQLRSILASYPPASLDPHQEAALRAAAAAGGDPSKVDLSALKGVPPTKVDPDEVGAVCVQIGGLVGKPGVIPGCTFNDVPMPPIKRIKAEVGVLEGVAGFEDRNYAWSDSDSLDEADMESYMEEARMRQLIAEPRASLDTATQPKASFITGLPPISEDSIPDAPTRGALPNPCPSPPPTRPAGGPQPTETPLGKQIGPLYKGWSGIGEAVNNIEDGFDRISGNASTNKATESETSTYSNSVKSSQGLADEKLGPMQMAG